MSEALEKWREAATKWNKHREAKRLTAWEACGLELWVALSSVEAKLEAMERENKRLMASAEWWKARAVELEQKWQYFAADQMPTDEDIRRAQEVD